MSSPLLTLEEIDVDEGTKVDEVDAPSPIPDADGCIGEEDAGTGDSDNEDEDAVHVDGAMGAAAGIDGAVVAAAGTKVDEGTQVDEQDADICAEWCLLK